MIGAARASAGQQDFVGIPGQGHGEDEAKALYAAEPDRYFYPDQYNNPGNWRVALRHDSAGDSSSRPAAALRTSSPAWARAARSWASAGGFAKCNPAIRLISVQPDSPLHGARRAEAHGDGDRAGHLRPDAG